MQFLRVMSPRGTKTTFVSLVVMVAAFFVPALRSCSDEPFQAPAAFAFENATLFSWIVPVFFAAAVMALLTVRVMAARAVERGVRRGALVTVAALALLNTGATAVFLASDSFPDGWMLALAVLGGAGAAAMVRRARGRHSLAIWDHLVAAFGLTAATSGPASYLGSSMLLGHTHNLASGAYLFVGATVLLAATAMLRALRPA